MWPYWYPGAGKWSYQKRRQRHLSIRSWSCVFLLLAHREFHPHLDFPELAFSSPSFRALLLQQEAVKSGWREWWARKREAVEIAKGLRHGQRFRYDGLGQRHRHSRTLPPLLPRHRRMRRKVP